MPRREYVIRVFVSSPCDLAEERQLLEELVRELNVTWSRLLGLRLELVRWETSVMPGVGPEPQAVIESETGDDYDTFIGLLWKRFGTPTVAAASGTAQEFERALARARVDSSLRMMVYFNETPVSPSDIDPIQLKQVHAFRQSLGQRGVLWLSYRTREGFTQLLRLHLSKLAQEWHARLVSAREPQPQPSKIASLAGPRVAATLDETEPEEEEGILDLMELIQGDLATLTATAERISQAITDVGTEVGAGASALQSLKESGSKDNARIKRTINHTAEDVDAFSKRVEAEVPILATVYERIVKAVARAAIVQLDFADAGTQLPPVIAAAQMLVRSFRGAKDGAEGMRQAAAEWPRLSTAMNHARRRVVDALDNLTAEFQKAIDVTAVVITNLQGRLDEGEASPYRETHPTAQENPGGR